MRIPLQVAVYLTLGIGLLVTTMPAQGQSMALNPLQGVTETLPRLLPARVKTFHKASSDPDEHPASNLRGNDDGFSGVNQVECYRETVNAVDYAVLVDVQGRSGHMGTFFRNFWAGYAGVEPTIDERNPAQIVLDGTVAFDRPIVDYFRSMDDPAGQVAPFDGPFTASRGGGHVTHEPLTWGNSFKVRVAENHFDNAARFHRVAGMVYPPEGGVTAPDMEAWEVAYERIGGWRHDVMRRRVGRALEIQPGGSDSIDLRGPSTLLELRVRVEVPEDFNFITARFVWDGRGEASVEVPLRLLGGMMRKPFKQAVDTLYFGNNGEDEVWCYYPMPFGEHARLEFTNSANRAVPMEVTLATHRSVPSGEWGYFTAMYQREITQTGLTVQGPHLTDCRGTLRALMLETAMDTSGQITDMHMQHLEGDLCIRTNGDRGDEHNFAATETSVGTWGWYGRPSDVLFVSDTAFNTGMHVMGWPDGLLESNRIQGSTFVFEPIHFVDGIEIAMEHGIQNDSNADYGLFSVFYLRDGAARELIRSLDVGDDTVESTQQVGYGVAPASEVTSGFFRDRFFGTEELTDEVRDVQDWYVWDVSIPNAARWKGLCLGFRLHRPRLGTGGICQAQIYVNGAPAGLLHSATSNAYSTWREGGELEVELPLSLTRDQSALSIEIRHVDNTEPLMIGEIKLFGYTED